MKRFLIAAAAIAISSSAFATEYTYKNDKDVETFNVEFKNGEIITKYCDSADKCRDGKQNVDKLKNKLKDLIDGHKADLKDKKALTAKVKKQTQGDKVVMIEDKAAQVKYYLVKVGSMRLPIPEEDVKKGDFSRVVGAIEANVRRYSSAVALLSSGKLPKSVSSDKYQDTAKVRELENIVAFADYLDNNK